MSGDLLQRNTAIYASPNLALLLVLFLFTTTIVKWSMIKVTDPRILTKMRGREDEDERMQRNDIELHYLTR